MSKAEAVLTTALEYFIEHGKPVLISALAKACGTSAKVVNEALWDRHPDFDLTEITVATGTTWNERSRLAPAVTPSRTYLARLLKAERNKHLTEKEGKK